MQENTVSCILGKTLTELFDFVEQPSNEPNIRLFENGNIVAKVVQSNKPTNVITFLYNKDYEEYAFRIASHELEYKLPSKMKRLQVEALCLAKGIKNNSRMTYKGEKYYIKDITDIMNYFDLKKVFVPIDDALRPVLEETKPYITKDVVAYLSEKTNCSMKGNIDYFNAYWKKEFAYSRNLMVYYRGGLYIARNLSKGINFEFTHMETETQYHTYYKRTFVLPLIPVVL